MVDRKTRFWLIRELLLLLGMYRASSRWLLCTLYFAFPPNFQGGFIKRFFRFAQRPIRDFQNWDRILKFLNYNLLLSARKTRYQWCSYLDFCKKTFSYVSWIYSHLCQLSKRAFKLIDSNQIPVSESFDQCCHVT